MQEWARRDSNPEPRDYESPALTTELQALLLCFILVDQFLQRNYYFFCLFDTEIALAAGFVFPCVGVYFIQAYVYETTVESGIGYMYLDCVVVFFSTVAVDIRPLFKQDRPEYRHY